MKYLIKCLLFQIFDVILQPKIKNHNQYSVKQLKKEKDYECSTSCRAVEAALPQ